MTETPRPRGSRVARTEPGSIFELSSADASVQQQHFGATLEQIRHDFVISHVLAALAPVSDRFIFYGGTALSRTFLRDLRLSEDIDLLSVGPRAPAARAIDEAMRLGLERDFGKLTANQRLFEVHTDTTASHYQIGSVSVSIQLIDGQDYTPWPKQRSTVIQRYRGLADLQLNTFTAESFAAAKTTAWCDLTRNAPRDLYDLWAMAERGLITPAAAQVYKKFGPTNGFPRRWAFPSTPPSNADWFAALGHQCIPKVGPDEAYQSVIDAWDKAVEDVELDPR